MDKPEFRRRITAAAAALDADYIKESDRGIFEKLLRLPEYRSARRIFSYYSFGREPDTHALICRARSDGKITALPRMLPDGGLEHREIFSEDEPVPGPFGLREPPVTAKAAVPAAGDIIIVPAVAFAEDGFRLGRGGGYYDRFLEKCPAFTVGLAREMLLCESVPVEPHDIRVNCIVTEKRVLRF